jgi:hypothetical protein
MIDNKIAIHFHYIKPQELPNGLAVIANSICERNELTAIQCKALARHFECNLIKVRDIDLYNDFGAVYFDKIARLLQFGLGFNTQKYADRWDDLRDLLANVLSDLGKCYPNLGAFELLHAFNHAITENPEICKSYDTKEGVLSFTTLYCSNIITFYKKHSSEQFKQISGLLAQSKIDTDVFHTNMQAIKNESVPRKMILENIGTWIYSNRLVLDPFFIINGKCYVTCLYELLGKYDLYIPTQESKVAAWQKYEKVGDKSLRAAYAQKDLLIPFLNSFKPFKITDNFEAIVSLIFFGADTLRVKCGKSKRKVGRARKILVIGKRKRFFTKYLNGKKVGFRRSLRVKVLRNGCTIESVIRLKGKQNVAFYKAKIAENPLCLYEKCIVAQKEYRRRANKGVGCTFSQRGSFYQNEKKNTAYYELALYLGFFQQIEIPKSELMQQMSIEQILHKYGSKVMSLFNPTFMNSKVVGGLFAGANDILDLIENE